MHLENDTQIGIDVTNAGRLEVGFTTGLGGPDLSVPGAATIRSTFTQTAAGTLAVNLAGHTQGKQYDLLNVTENATLDGTLEVSLIDGFVPSVGDLFQILKAQSIIGTFASLTTSDENDALGFSATVLYSPTDVQVRFDDVFLLGDYNRNGHVDAADYTVYRNSLGQSGPNLPADGNGDGHITLADYDVWKSHYGQPLGSGAGQTSAEPSVPEPTTVTILLCAAIAIAASRNVVGTLRVP